MRLSRILLFLFPLVLAALSGCGKTYDGPTIQWTSIEEAEKLAAQDGKFVYVDVYTDWCGWCKRLDEGPYHDSTLVKYINAHYHPVKLNAEERNDIHLGGKIYSFNGKFNQLGIAILEERMSFPSTVILDEKMQRFTGVSGYHEAPYFLALARYFGEKVYEQKVPLQEYLDKEAGE